MQLLDPDIQECCALVIDGNPTSRSTLVGMLREFGLGTVAQCSRATDARRILELRRFDIVLCEHHFDQSHGGGYDGQDLLDELRRAQLLPFSTVFIMVTGEASYAKVAEAAESALDSYLLKPHNATILADRVQQARHRKKVLKPIFSAIEAGDHGRAAALCLERYGRRGEFWLYAARIGAELLLRIGQHDAARRLFESVRETRALPWTKLGIARAELDGGAPQQARRTLQELIANNPGYADAYDVLGRVHLDHGELDAALTTYRRASELTPASIGRLQKLGALAFYTGDAAEATKALDKAMVTGISSKTFDLQSLVLLALLRFDQADSRGLQRVVDTLTHAVEQTQRRKPARAELDPDALIDTVAETAPDETRVRNLRLLAITQVLHALMQRQSDSASRTLRELGSTIREAEFDFESAINLVSLLSRLAGGALVVPEAEGWLRALAMRFCVSKATTDLLLGAARAHEPTQTLIREAQASITGMAERAMTHSVKGSPAIAVQTLLRQGGENLNAKLLELAQLVLERYRDRIDMYPEMHAQAQGLLQRYCAQGTRINLNETGRSAGSLALRG